MSEAKENEMEMIPMAQRVIAVLWPSFLVSGIATILFFSAFDPQEFVHTNISRMGAYSVGFFSFWLMSLSSSLLTLYFQLPCHRVVPTKRLDDH